MPKTISPEDRALARQLAKNEEKLKAPTQEQFDQLYAEVYDFMLAKKIEAEEQGKPPLFISGETHWTPLGKSSLVLETMMLHVGLELGIKTVYEETDKSSLDQRKQLAELDAKIRTSSVEEYKKFENDMSVSVHLLKQPAFKKALTIFPTLPSGISNPDLYERHMSDAICKKKTPGVLLTGLKHLQGLSQDKALNSEYAVTFVAAPISDQVRAMRGSENNAATEFALTSPVVQRFTVNGKLIDTRVGKLLEMVDRAKDHFKPQAVVGDKKKQSSLPQQASQPVRPIQPEPPAHPEYAQKIGLFSSNSDVTAQPAIGQSTDVVAIRTGIPHPVETTPVVVALAAFGFWAGTKLGLCPRLSGAALPLNFNDEKSAQMAQERTRESSAEKFFAGQGSSLEAASIHCFDKTYSEGTLEKRQQIKAFIIDVVLGDVTPEIGKGFNQYSKITDTNLRSKKLQELMTEHLEFSAEAACNFSM